MTRGVRDVTPLRYDGKSTAWLERRCRSRWPGANPAVERAWNLGPQLLRYQALALYGLAHQYNNRAARIFDIGTAGGFSAAVISLACPLAAEVLTITPAIKEAAHATVALSNFANVRVQCVASWDYLEEYERGAWSMIFVDADHKRAARDLVWWNHLGPGSLFLWHDYTPHCSPHVVAAIDELSALLHRRPGVLVRDDNRVGMVGFYKRPMDPKWPTGGTG